MKKLSRLTIDLPEDMHLFFKMVSVELGISMRQYFIESALKHADDLEDEYLAKKAHKLLKEIKAGKEKTITFKEMKKRIGWDEI
ncbi:MAG: hypothetical protein KR126chlam5_00870 [Candidatus Anoxychlamydiales bacterium]|nr:hypothetical protein [Candidatus Anoxychlamydiales bacterium]NGX52567.1 hypothetical protein [Candidatus Anoxychlamydiales bacterium]